MSNSTPTHSPKLISGKKKNRKRRESRDRTCCPHRERERLEGTENRGQGVDVGARRLAQSNFDKGQRATAAIEGGWVEKNLRCGFNFQSKKL